MWLCSIIYALLGLTDLVLSLAGFLLKVPEGNPVLKWLAGYGLFVPAKIILTLLVCTLIILLYNRYPKTKIIGWSAIGFMILTNFYHLWALNRLLPP